MNRPDVRLQSILFAVTFHLANGRCPCKRFPNRQDFLVLLGVLSVQGLRCCGTIGWNRILW
jgi:hypothetical protein